MIVEFPTSGCNQQLRSHRFYSLSDFLLEVVNVIDMSVIDHIFHLVPQKKVQRGDVCRPGRPEDGTSSPCVVEKGTWQMGRGSIFFNIKFGMFFKIGNANAQKVNR